MKRYGIVFAIFLLAGAFVGLSIPVLAEETNTSSPPPLPPLPPLGDQDLAQILYQVKRDLVKQEGKLEAAMEALLEAREEYVENPNSSTYKAILRAAQTDTNYLNAYSDIVSKAQALVAQAKGKFFGETPITKQEMQAGPQGPKGEGPESLAKELNKPEQQIVQELEQEIAESGGSQSAFAKALQAQTTKLKSAKDRVVKEKQSPAVSSNPEAQKQDTDIQKSLSNAIDARMEAMFCASNKTKDCCQRYPNNKRCEPKN